MQEPDEYSSPRYEPTGAFEDATAKAGVSPTMDALPEGTQTQTSEDVVERVLTWYADAARDLPWRRPETSPWGVMVSEFMLQQTPVARVLTPWAEWMGRWPTPDALAEEPASAAVAAWGRLGYPRRALRLHAAARIIAENYSGEVPEDEATLRTLPGVGQYTAAAIASFAFGRRATVLDTNIRRVFARVVAGEDHPGKTTTKAEWDLAAQWVPSEPTTAATWAAASMELGATVCTARNPRCHECPISDACRWNRLGRPANPRREARTQAWEGTDRQRRGHLLDIVRNNPSGVEIEVLLENWPERSKSERCLASLEHDQLVHRRDSLVLLGPPTLG